MPKQKFNSVDVAAEVAELRRLVVGSWLANIYDLDDKRTFLLKFTKSGGRTESGEGEKTVVLLESGARFHTTSYVRERKADAPSKLNAKLRMHLKGKRLNAVCQLGRDRAVEFVFGAGDTKHSLVLELYAQGNVVLLDKNDVILTLLRPVRDDDAGLAMLGNHAYDRSRFRADDAFREVTVFDVEAALATGDVSRRVDATKQTGTDDGVTTTTDGVGDDGVARRADAADAASAAAPKKIPVSKDASASSRSPRTLREALCRAFGFSPQTADWVATKAGAEDGGVTKLPLSGDENGSARLVQNVAKALGELRDWLDGVSDGSIRPEGHAEETFLFDESVSPEDAVDAVEKTERKGTWVSESFSPFPFVAFGEDDARVRRVLDPRGFDALVDAHFAAIESLADRRARERAVSNANKRADKVKRDQERRANDLRREERLQETRATLIEYNLEKVDAVLVAVNALLASGQSWDEIERFVEDEKRHGNPVAGLVKNLDLKNNAVTVGLVNRLDDDDDDEDEAEAEVVSLDADDATKKYDESGETPAAAITRRRRKPSVAVTLDLSLSAYANAREHFERKKRHAAKLTKTENQSGRALESARRDSEARVKMAATQKKIGVGSVSLARPTEWFEKFHWFITPENCLVLSARDASQTRLLVEKYMGPHDAFVRADVAKAPATVVKAPREAVVRHYEEKEGKNLRVADSNDSNDSNDSKNDSKKCLVPSLSLAHAGAACLCRSAAWDTRTVISAWWVPASAVRLVAENGDALAPGVVWHVGRKRYLPPAPLVMGYAYAFLVRSEDDVKRHAADRTARVLEETDGSSHEEVHEEEIEEPEERTRARGISAEVLRETRRPASSALDAFLDGSVETTRARRPVAEADADPPARCDRDGDESDKDPKDEAPDAIQKTSAQKKMRGGKARVSAAERRRLKKKETQKANGVDSNSNSIDGVVSHEKQKQNPPKNAAASAKTEPKKQKPLPRGKSAKARRAAARYAEQDDEDRALAMALLGVKMKDDAFKRDADDDDDDDDDDENAVSRMSAQSDDDATTTTTTTRAKGEDVDDEIVGGGVSDASSDASSEDASEDDATVSFLERDLARVARVDWFTGAPFLETEVTHAIALVAPWDALKAFAYKAKLTPGAQKKGKAAKQALDVVTRAPPAADVMRCAKTETKPKTVDGFDHVEDVSRPKDKEKEKESRREKAARAERDAALKATIAAAAAAAAAGDGAVLMCGQGLKVSMPAGAAKAMNAAKKNASGKRG